MTNYEAWAIKTYTIAGFNTLTSIEQMTYLVSLAHLSSSTHNTQPWAFHLDPDLNQIIIYLDKSRVLPASDVVGRQACISLGCAIGNLKTVSEYYGIFSSIKYHDVNPKIVLPVSKITKTNRYLKIATLLLKDSLPDKHLAPLIKAMITRRLERRKHDPSKDFLPSYYLELKKILTSESEISYRLWRRGDPRIKIVAELQSQADSFVANSSKFSGELSEWLLPNNTKKYLGMPGSTFNLSDKQAVEVVEGLSSGNKIHADSLAGFSLAGKKGIESAAMVCMITIQKQSVSNWLKVGQNLARVQNLVESVGGGLAIHAGLAEVGLVRMSLAAMGMTTHQPAILFRAGIRDSSAPRLSHSPRLPLSQVLI